MRTLAALVSRLGEAASDGSVQPYTLTREFKTYGSSFFVAPDGRSKDSDKLVVMSTPAISKAVKSVTIESKFVNGLARGEAAYVVRQYSTSAVVLLCPVPVEHAIVLERAMHSEATWRQDYRCEQRTRHAGAYQQMRPERRSGITMEGILRL